MVKLALKSVIIVGSIFILSIFPGNSNLVIFLLAVVLFFVIVLLSIIVWALVTELKIFQNFRRIRKKTKNTIAARPYLKINYKNIEVSYLWRLNGGGIIFAYEFIHQVAKKIGRVEHVFEYGAGPGFIGFGLLANNLCDRLTLSDINPEAVEAVKETIKNNNLHDKVTVYQSDCLQDIDPNEQWDLVVGNPPWHLSARDYKNPKICDPGSRVHEKFYRGINTFLKPGGSILFIEGGEFTDVSCFKNMIEKNGLRIVESFKPVLFLEFFKDMDKYSGLKMPFVLFLRLGLFFREVYFIWSKKNIN